MQNATELSEFQIFKSIFYHCLVMITVPIVSFFLCRALIFDALLGFNSVPSNVYSAIVAILVLHIALGAYIYRAYFDPRNKPPSKSD